MSYVIRAFVSSNAKIAPKMGLRQGKLVPFEKATIYQESDRAVKIAHTYAEKCAKRRIQAPVLIVEPYCTN